MQHVVVVGGGISGLAAAWELTGGAQGVSGDVAVTVLDGGDRVGGKLRGHRVAGVGVDVGAESVLARRPEALDLVEAVGLGDSLVHPTDARATVWSRGRRHLLPGRTLMGVPADPEALRGLLTDAEVARVLAEEPVPAAPGDQSVGDLVTARLGEAVTRRLVEPLLGGVYAGHADLLSAAAAVPALLRAAQRGRGLVEAAADLVPAPVPGADRPPVFAGIEGGLHRLPAAMAAELVRRGVRVETGVLVRELHPAADGSGWALVAGPRPAPTSYRADAVVLALPPAPTSRLLRDVAPQAAQALAGVQTASMAVVTLAFRAEELGELTGSGVLVPPVEGLRTKAATFSATKWDWVRRHGAGAGPRGEDLVLLRGSVGRHREEASLQVGDRGLVSAVLTDLGGVLGRELPTPVDRHVQRWGGALPQYAVGHLDTVAAVRAEVAGHRGLAVCGATYDGVGIPACIGSARTAVAALRG